MNGQSLHVFEDTGGLLFRDGWKIGQEFSKRTATFKVVEKRAHGYACADEDRGATKNLGIRVHAGN